MKRLLVTGASGMLGLNFSLLMSDRYEITGVCNSNTLRDVPFDLVRRDFFITDFAELLDELKPDAVIHCAAMANVDACETDHDASMLINARVPEQLAAACSRRGTQMVYISTDAVFDGNDCGRTGYRETDETNPVNWYGYTKLEGERGVLRVNPDALVARVNFYGWSISGKRSLSEIFYCNLKHNIPMKGFTDVFFTPLYVEILSEILVGLMEKGAHGIYHVFSSEYRSKYDFGVSIAERFGFDPDLISPVNWKDGGLTAKRSPNLIMNTEKTADCLGIMLPNQSECLERFAEAEGRKLPEQIQNYRKE